MNRILVLVEHRDGELEQVTHELLGEARRLVARQEGEVCAVLLGSDVERFAAELVRRGAHRVFVADDPRLARYDPGAWQATVAAWCQQHDPRLVLVPATSSGEDLAARLAVSENWALASRCTGVRFKGDRVEATRPVYGGKLQESIVGVGPGPFLVTVLPEVIGVGVSAGAGESAAASAVAIPPVFPSHPAVRVTGFLAASPDTLDLAEADVVVAAGRGMGGEEGVRMVRELAALLGGVVASTRVVVDLGWLGRETQVGQTGRTVKPRLYVACGVSGATQHTIGMRESAAVLAINTDPAAPIFKIADLALNADVADVLPALIDRCRERRSGTG